MTRKALKPKPWLQPGYTFSIGWPIGYEATAADSHKGKSTLENSINAQAGRKASAEAGKGWGRGTIAGLSKRKQQDIDKNERIRRGLA